MDGIIRCSRYAFGPNRLHYCGPDANQEILAYLHQNESDPGLELLLKGFKTMFPYLLLIARANGIADPFDERVVEAYWIGNDLLENVGKRKLYGHLTDTLEIKKKMPLASFSRIEETLRGGAVPHHSFHVMDIWRRTGNDDVAHTVESMDQCRISWGKVLAVDGPAISIETERLEWSPAGITLGSPEKRTIRRNLQSLYDIEQVAPGQIVTVHWGVPCEVISIKQAAQLRKYTLQHLRMADLVV